MFSQISEPKSHLTTAWVRWDWQIRRYRLSTRKYPKNYR